ncbi:MULTISPECIES: arginine ABC transporter permease ArtQ [Aggregatibacter]|jgi:amino ABC transporter, permease protein, 3-TM region, his/glu/gln/arg/opine family|uniref:Arginine ABC transporter permease ArtQ n=1 Tax=Aggregatibacter aphrophilus TaxID=732 RepID=A0ABX9VUI6_AGGAP|nr:MULTISPECIES: arginine ABC transporter permease ArtQ [Aggregatibacter]ACS96641.1 histidine transport system permease protein HisQ [Aggregatibacter aphrophilus NJ8700]AKS64041.1 ABC transporter [Aggregatibacter aphrophilus NJ8700]AKU63244.1 ABC transporter [Aggregatibacter aphrophilus]EHB90140.1 arginine ABC transporter permease ArtQ [Aggregatibacter aphrophilus F0387]RMW85996.1 arginine ABC transporter permease ArtQ [Aggregatibacter aphrophilus]
MFFDFLSLMFTAALMTLGLAVCSLVAGLLLSMLFAVLEANRVVGKPMAVLVALLRGLPEILVVLLVYFGSSEVVEMITGEYIEFGAFGCGVFALSLIFAAYASQTLRGAIQAIPKGQWESGAALGLSKGYTFLHIIMPQVWRHALPGLSNQWLVLLKDTALISLIGVDDLMRQAQLINTNTHQPFTWYGIAALIYLVVTLVSQVGIRKLELRFTRFEREVK